MKLSYFCAPSPNGPNRTKLVVKKVLTTLAATVAIAIATHDTAHKTSSCIRTGRERADSPSWTKSSAWRAFRKAAKHAQGGRPGK